MSKQLNQLQRLLLLSFVVLLTVSALGSQLALYLFDVRKSFGIFSDQVFPPK